MELSYRVAISTLVLYVVVMSAMLVMLCVHGYKTYWLPDNETPIVIEQNDISEHP